jgi:hypothetical protein
MFLIKEYGPCFQGAFVELQLKRMSTAKVADTRRLFDLFTEINDRTKRDGDPHAISCVRETIALWEAMLIAQYTHEECVSRNVLGMQRDCASWAEEVITMLGTVVALTPQLPVNDFTSTGTQKSQSVKDDNDGYHRFYSFEDEDTDEEDNDEKHEFDTPAFRHYPLRSIENWESEDRDLPSTEFSSRKSKTIPSLQFFRRPRPGSKTFPLERPDPSIVESCRRVCIQLTKALRTNLLVVPSANISAGFTTKSTCGMMLIGTAIDNMVVGGD